MFRKAIILSLCVGAVLTACQRDGKTTDQDLSTGSTTDSTSKKSREIPPEFGTVKNDTLFIGGKFVIFYGPVETAESAKQPSQEALITFKSGSAALMDSLSKYPDIKTVYTTASYFKIYTAAGFSMVVSKAGYKQDFGVVASDGQQPPTMKKGILTISEYHKFLKDYFLLK